MRIKVIKIGGAIVEDEAALATFCDAFAAMEGPKVLVHGGGVLATALQKALGQEARMVEGRRVTDDDALKVATMAYGGWAGKHICALLQQRGCNAISLSGCDGSVITASRRGPRLLSDGITMLDYGFVGDVTAQSVDAKMLSSLIDLGLTPVLNAINHDGCGQLLNTNADTVASSVASALGAELWLIFEKEGVLRNVDDPCSVIKTINPTDFETLKAEGIVSAGMLPKIENAFKALESGACKVKICNQDALNNPTSGTDIVW